MKIFEFKDLRIVCEWKKTRMAFKHEATLFQDGRQINFAKICYLNRTWESFEYESIIWKVLAGSKKFSQEECKEILDAVNPYKK